MSQGNRVRRVEEAVLRVIGEKLISEVQFQYITRVTVTGVDMSPDLRNAKIFFSILATTEEEKAQIFTALKRKRKRLRMIVGRELDLRFVPELHFEIDDTIEKASRIDHLINKIHQNESPGSDEE